jgi:primosomal protein N' (replication factor Y) (superfamily II helicase)
MYYYEVLVTQAYAARQSIFTYASQEELNVFQYVFVPLQRKVVAAIVVKKVPKPAFATKPITKSIPYALTKDQQAILTFVRHYYMATDAQALELFVPSYLGKLPDAPTNEHTTPPVSPNNLPPLTAEQQEALTTLQKHSTEQVLLHGDTGTGKTRLFIERARDVVQANKSVLILAPEIALIPQLAKQLRLQFGEIVHEYHSAKTPKQRAHTWQHLKANNTPHIVVGTRSALFLPIKNIGLIVVDESHEPAYKQEEGVRYHASRVAGALAHATQAQLILASATPLVSDVARIHRLRAPIIRLTIPAIRSAHETQTIIVDMKHRDLFSAHPLLSKQLISSIETALQNKEQSLVYLNRRGTARSVLCAQCGWQAVCPTCNIAMTYHHDTYYLQCHMCDKKQAVPHACPTCGSPEVLFKSAGTKALVEWLQKRFPQARIGRFDTDNTKAESLAERHTEVARGNIDILVGTQMLVKGLDLPHLSVVGIVSADLSLQIPDYTAEERTYQLVRQAIGRVGRGHRSGMVILQTFNPNNKLILYATSKNYDDFYTTQIEQRKAYAYPPLCDVALFWCMRKSAQSALQNAQDVTKLLGEKLPHITIVGPVVALHTKKRGYVTAQFVVKSTKRSDLNSVVNILPTGWQFDLEPAQLL